MSAPPEYLRLTQPLARFKLEDKSQEGGPESAEMPDVCETRKEGNAMSRIRLGTNFTIFALFFGVAALEAFQTRNWLKAAFWLAIGGVFLIADNSRWRGKEN